MNLISIIFALFIICIFNLYNLEESFNVYKRRNISFKSITTPKSISNIVLDEFIDFDTKQYDFIDFGSGDGDTIYYFSKYFNNLIGIELNNESYKLSLLKDKKNDNINFLNMNMINYKFNNKNTVLYIYEPLWGENKDKAIKIYNNVFKNLLKAFNNSYYNDNIIIIYITSYLDKHLSEKYFNYFGFKLKKKINNGGYPYRIINRYDYSML